MSTKRLFARALVAIVALPGTVALVVPQVLLRARGPTQPLTIQGLVTVTVGCLILSWCVRDFYVVGRGTLAPWSPPDRLVTTGPYRYSRNPMYIGVLLILSGWALGYGSLLLAVYACLMMAAFHIRIVRSEEPWLVDRYGAAWLHYRQSAPRWLF